MEMKTEILKNNIILEIFTMRKTRKVEYSVIFILTLIESTGPTLYMQ